jgi:hypothetical protein
MLLKKLVGNLKPSCYEIVPVVVQWVVTAVLDHGTVAFVGFHY